MSWALFEDRADAGRRLAKALAAFKPERPIVYALPRGGAETAYEVARALGAPLDLILVRKLGAPHQPELAVGAVADGANPFVFVNQAVAFETGADAAFLEAETNQELAEIERRRKAYFGATPRADPKGRTVIVVDDGLATGATAKAALQAIRAQGAAKVVLAIPVAPADTLVEMKPFADEVVCLETPELFMGVGQFYADFRQLGDADVIRFLKAAAR